LALSNRRQNRLSDLPSVAFEDERSLLLVAFSPHTLSNSIYKLTGTVAGPIRDTYRGILSHSARPFLASFPVAAMHGTAACCYIQHNLKYRRFLGIIFYLLLSREVDRCIVYSHSCLEQEQNASPEKVSINGIFFEVFRVLHTHDVPDIPLWTLYSQ